jgi:hypothetical protein
VPVVGAAFSVTYMAMDAGNIYQHLQELSTPNSYIIKLTQLQNSQSNGGLPHISTLESEVGMLCNSIRDLNVRLKELREEQDQEGSAQKQKGSEEDTEDQELAKSVQEVDET